MTGLTPTQDKVLRFIASRETSPSYDEIRIALGFASKGGVARIVGQLVERGVLRRLPMRARSLEVISRVPTTADLRRLPEHDLSILAERVGAEMDRRGWP